MAQQVYKAYAIRSDKNDLPIIEVVKFVEHESRRKYGKSGYRLLKPCKHPCVYNHFDKLRGHWVDDGEPIIISKNFISNDYDRGWTFDFRGDALTRIERMIDKKKEIAEQLLSEIAGMSARLDRLRME